MGKGTGDRAEGAWDQAKGRVREAVGDLEDDPSKKSQGRRDQAKGKAKEAWGKLKDAGEDLRRKSKD